MGEGWGGGDALTPSPPVGEGWGGGDALTPSPPVGEGWGGGGRLDSLPTRGGGLGWGGYFGSPFLTSQDGSRQRHHEPDAQRPQNRLDEANIAQVLAENRLASRQKQRVTGRPERVMRAAKLDDDVRLARDDGPGQIPVDPGVAEDAELAQPLDIARDHDRRAHPQPERHHQDQRQSRRHAKRGSRVVRGIIHDSPPAVITILKEKRKRRDFEKK